MVIEVRSTTISGLGRGSNNIWQVDPKREDGEEQPELKVRRVGGREEGKREESSNDGHLMLNEG